MTHKRIIHQLFKFLNHNDMTLNLRSLFVILLFAAGGSLYAQIGIGTQTPNDNAALEIKSPDKGLLIPRIDLGSTATTFLGSETGNDANGMFVYHTGDDLDGEGLYVWQYDSSSTSGKWVKFATAEEISASVEEGSTADATLRWDDSANKWVEEDGLKVTSDGNTTVAGTLTVTGAVTASDNLTVASGKLLKSEGNFEVSGTSTLNGNVTLGSDATFTVTNGAVNLGSGTVTAEGAITSKGDLSVTNDGSGTNGNFSVDGTSTLKGNVSLESGATLTVADGAVNLGTAKTTAGSLDVTGDTKLSGKLTASDGTAGTEGQILTATSDGKIQWKDAPASKVETVTTTGTIKKTTGTLIINSPTPAADITMTLPTDAEEGHTIKIRRNFDYTGTSDSVIIDTGTNSGTKQKINEQDEKKLNVGYQSVTLVYIGSDKWVSID